MTRSLSRAVSAISPRLAGRTVGLLLVLSTSVGPLGCESQIGLAGVEYDRRPCGTDTECDAPLKCRFSTGVPFLCETPPASATRRLGEAVGSGEDFAVCESNYALESGLCTGPCRGNAECLGSNLPSCRPVKLRNDTRSVLLCSTPQ